MTGPSMKRALSQNLLKIMRILKILVVVSVSFCLTGFDFSKHSIPTSEIRSGGPPKDGIPALTDPKFISAGQAKYLKPQDRVLGVVLNGEARAYPLRILNWHEIVNDIIGPSPVVITYCPLTGSGIAYETQINKSRIKFGVSGKLYNSNLLLYDRSTESLWSQLKMEAVTGEMTGTKLEPISVLNTTWQDWRRSYPGTRVLALDTGYRRDYDRDPYEKYHRSPDIYFTVSNIDRRLPLKEWVLGVIINGKAKAYPFAALAKVSSPLPDKLGGEDILVYFDEKKKCAWVESEGGRSIPSVQAYWFAWHAFYPDGEIFGKR